MRRRRTQFELLHMATEFFLSVENHDQEWTSRHVISRPSNLDSIIPWLCRIVLAQYGSIFVVFPLHLHSEGSFRASDADCQLTGTSAFSVADETTLIESQDTGFDSRTVNSNLRRVRSSTNLRSEGRSCVAEIDLISIFRTTFANKFGITYIQRA